MQLEKSEKIFVIPDKQPTFDAIYHLKKEGFIKHEGIFRLLFGYSLNTSKLTPGGYLLDFSMDSFAISKKLMHKSPDLVWITIGACLRKEQIGEILGTSFNWSPKQLDEWNKLYNETPEYKEGVYYPDTYLIPKSETVSEIGARFINRFNEKFAPYTEKFMKANVRWTTALKIASLIAREAAGEKDMKLISGIIWNRLNIDMPLQIDATMQYTKGKNEKGMWWGAIDIKEKQKDSPYNSYLYKGLPPTPICSPDIRYIDAVLNSEETECLYYLHDSKQNIYCAKTYEEHLDNIEKYLN